MVRLDYESHLFYSIDMQYLHITILLLPLLLAVFNADAADQKHYVLKLPERSEWQKKIFAGETLYKTIRLGEQYVLRASSQGTASGLVREIHIDLRQTPFLNWSWKIESVLEQVNEKTKLGDDYVARVYVVISGGLLFWKTRALSYVWSSSETKGSSWPNAFSDNAVMVSVESGNEYAGEWRHEKRNVLEDMQNLLGIDAGHIDAVAIMTDTDNSQQSATAWYGDIFFSAE